MREILFRGKIVGEHIGNDPQNNWFYGSLVKELSTGKTYILDVAHTHKGKAIFSTLGVEVYPETFGQFTGLLDKNGTKIFEGDIVRVKVNQTQDILLYGDVVKEGIVRYDDEYPHFTLKGNFMNFVNWYYNGDIEVIGNIHDKGGVK